METQREREGELLASRATRRFVSNFTRRSSSRFTGILGQATARLPWLRSRQGEGRPGGTRTRLVGYQPAQKRSKGGNALVSVNDHTLVFNSRRVNEHNRVFNVRVCHRVARFFFSGSQNICFHFNLVQYFFIYHTG
jgi:hypothetical protein